MLKQRTIKSLVKTVGIGLHSGRKVSADPATGPRRCRHRIHPCRSAGTGGNSRGRQRHRRHAPGVRAPEERRARLDGGTPDVGLRWPGHRQSLRRRGCRGNPDHGRQRRVVRVPAAVGGDRGAVGRQAFHPREEGRGSARGRQAGPAGAVLRLQALVHDRLPPSGRRQDRPGVLDRFRRHELRARDRPGLHLRLRPRGGSAARNGPGLVAAAWTTPSCWTSTAC